MAKYTKRSDGRYATRVSTGKYTDDGRAETIYVYGKTIKELEEKLTKIKYEMQHGIYSFTSDSRFSDYAEEWLEHSKANRGINTKKMYSDVIKNHTELLSKKKLKDISRLDIQKQINACAEHPRTCQQLKITLSQIFEAAIDDNILLKNPVRNVELPRLVTKEKRAFTSAEKKAIKEADYNSEERAFIMLLYCLGLRKAEALALTWSDINFKTNEITICKSLVYSGEKPNVCYPKTDSSIRVLAMHPLLVKALKSYKRNSKGLLLFAGDSYYTKSGGNTLFKHSKRKIEAQLGHKTEITSHYFRHNMASELYYLVSLKEAIRFLGHADERMIIKVYAHLDSLKENTKDKIASMNL